MALERMQQQWEDPEAPLFDVVFVDMQMPDMDGAALGRAIRADARFNSTQLVMMTSMTHRGDASLFAEIGFSTYFPKPTTTVDLLDSLNVVLENGEALKQASPLVTHHYLKGLERPERALGLPHHSDDGQPLHLLLVEDNFINQDVAKGILQELGFSCDVAANGLEAIELLKKASPQVPYHLVLMDCQMPHMDGYQATGAIRDGEAGAGLSTIPIIAMTANAMSGDRKKCLDAGMNDYLSKPIDADLLEEKLQHWLMPASLVDSRTDNTDPIWDKSTALRRLQGKQKRLQYMVQLFLEDMPVSLAQLQLAVEHQDISKVINQTHALKGVVGNLSATALFQAVSALEVASAKDNYDDIVCLMETVLDTYQPLEQCLREYLDAGL